LAASRGSRKNRNPVAVYTIRESRYIFTPSCRRLVSSLPDRPCSPGRIEESRDCKQGGVGPGLPKECSVSPVEEKVIEIVSEQLNIPKEDIKLESSFQDDLKADSLDVVELVMEFEDEFEVTIPDEDYEKIRTVGDAIKYIQEKQ
jgi:acyl carrier protein